MGIAYSTANAIDEMRYEAEKSGLAGRVSSVTADLQKSKRRDGKTGRQE